MKQKLFFLYRIMLQQILLFIVCFFSLSETFASDTTIVKNSYERQREILINSGYFNYSSIDNLFSDNVYSGGNLFYGLTYNSRKRILIHTAIKFSIFDRVPKSLQTDPSIVAPDSRFVTINQLHFEMENIYRFKVLQNNLKNAIIYFSANWCTLGDWVINDYMEPELIISSIAPGFYCEYTFRKLQLYLQFSTSLLSYTCRDSYSFAISSEYETYGSFDFLKNNSDIQFPNSMVNCFANAGLNLDISKHWGVNIAYYFRYLNNSEPRTLKSITNICSLGLTYKLVKK